MENILVGLITLGGLYTIAQQEQNETFVQKPCPEQLGSGQSPILVKLESQVFKEFINKNGNELQLK
mgnify:CR=1 FL=1